MMLTNSTPLRARVAGPIVALLTSLVATASWASPGTGEVVAHGQDVWLAQLDPADGSDGGAEITLDEIVARVQASYDRVDDFVADFTQEYTNVALGDTDTSTGRVHFLKPGMMRWDYVSPMFRIFVSDGSALWIYEPEEGLYYTQPLADSDLPSALRFLMGDGRIEEDFEISRVDDRAGRLVLELVPVEDEGQYTKLRFVVDPETWSVTETTIYDPLGNTNRIRFSNREENVGYEAADFRFVPPEGATRVADPDDL